MSGPEHFVVRANTPSCHTLTAAHLARLWRTLEREDRRRWLFYDGVTACEDDYLDFMLSPDVFAYGVYDHRDTPLATYFVNNFLGDAGQMHFCFFRAGQQDALSIGRATVRFLLEGGLSALIGITPRPFRHAWRLALASGFTQAAILPRACRILHNGRRRTVDAVATLCTLQTLGPPQRPVADGPRRQSLRA